MAFTQASASTGERTGHLLSADNARPERHILIETLRRAAPLMGLKAHVIATLDAMLSCLPPKRQHNTVFASNATLAFRRNGISDRTIRRHVAILQEMGLLVRRDSPNRKRFIKKNTAEGTALRFGFDLSPLFDHFARIADLAGQALREEEEIAYLKTKIRAHANDILRVDPSNADATMALRALRRSLSADTCRTLINQLGANHIEAEQLCDADLPDEKKMSGSNGQNVRHHQNSNKELIDKEGKQDRAHGPVGNRTESVSVPEILIACPEAAQFALTPLRTMSDVIAHGQALAPMIGIDARTFEQAKEKLGIEGAALTVWAVTQLHKKIRKVGAYFRSITSGTKSHDFCPDLLIQRLAQSDGA